jgi:hypothetical protein
MVAQKHMVCVGVLSRFTDQLPLDRNENHARAVCTEPNRPARGGISCEAL